MHTTLNATETDIVEEHRNGDRFLVAKDIRIIKPKHLNNGYVPERSIQQSVNQRNTHGGTGWDGVPATLRHPRNESDHPWHDPARPEREPVLSATANVEEELGMGELENQRFEDGDVFVDLAVNADRAAEIGDGAMAVVEALEDGDPLDVSTQYLGAELPPGRYDGQQYHEAEAILSPDSLALLPNTEGECSTVEGCGVNPVQSSMAVAANNSEVRLSTGHSDSVEGDDGVAAGPAQAILQVATNAIDRIASLGASSPEMPDGYWEDLAVVDGVDVDGVVQEFTGGDGDAENSTSDEPADTGTGQQITANSNMDREELMMAIMENSDIKQESLEGMGDSCLQTTHDSVVGDVTNDEDDSTESAADDEADVEDTEEMETESETNNSGEKEMIPRDEVESLISEEVEQQVTANKEKRQKEQRVERIVANSAEYGQDDADELMETPDGVLDRIEKGLGAGTELPPAGSPTVNTGGDDELGDIDVGTGMIDDIMAGGD